METKDKKGILEILQEQKQQLYHSGLQAALCVVREQSKGISAKDLGEKKSHNECKREQKVVNLGIF